MKTKVFYKRLFIMIGVLSVVTACLFFTLRRPVLHCEGMRVQGGYGYVVLHGRDTLILQPYMPAVGGGMPFATEKEALKAGRLVCRKLSEGQPPTLSREEVEACISR